MLPPPVYGSRTGCLSALLPAATHLEISFILYAIYARCAIYEIQRFSYSFYFFVQFAHTYPKAILHFAKPIGHPGQKGYKKIGFAFLQSRSVFSVQPELFRLSMRRYSKMPAMLMRPVKRNTPAANQ